MAIKLTDQEIAALMQEPKKIPNEYGGIFQLKDKKGHKEQEITIPRSDGSLFKIIIRQNRFNILDFSIILGYIAPKSNVLFRLVRVNGKSHKHSNKIEGTDFYDFHIHKATERYQYEGFDEDTYAEVTNEYADIHKAWELFIKECNIILPENSQLPLFR